MAPAEHRGKDPGKARISARVSACFGMSDNAKPRGFPASSRKGFTTISMGGHRHAHPPVGWASAPYSRSTSCLTGAAANSLLVSLGVSDSSQPEGCSVFKHYGVRNECMESGAAYPEVKTRFRNQLSVFTIVADNI